MVTVSSLWIFRVDYYVHVCWVKISWGKKWKRTVDSVFQFYGKYSWEKIVKMYLRYFSFVFFFLSFRGLEFSLIISIMHMGKIADSLALKCRAVTYNNQIRKKSLCENAVNHIFMFNHLILFKSKSKLSLFQQETPLVTKCFFVGYFGYMWYSITWHKYKLYSIERLNVI